MNVYDHETAVPVGMNEGKLNPLSYTKHNQIDSLSTAALEMWGKRKITFAVAQRAKRGLIIELTLTAAAK